LAIKIKVLAAVWSDEKQGENIVKNAILSLARLPVFHALA
jgi:hypothetical protein